MSTLGGPLSFASDGDAAPRIIMAAVARTGFDLVNIVVCLPFRRSFITLGTGAAPRGGLEGLRNHLYDSDSQGLTSVISSIGTIPFHLSLARSSVSGEFTTRREQFPLMLMVSLSMIRRSTPPGRSNGRQSSAPLASSVHGASPIVRTPSTSGRAGTGVLSRFWVHLAMAVRRASLSAASTRCRGPRIST
jgi:hypothetical protein